MSQYFATKYDSATEEVIACLADYMEGFGVPEFGDVDCPTGYVQAVTLDATCDLDFSDHTNYPIGDYVGELARTYGVQESDVIGWHIVQSNTQGFVYVSSFPDEPSFLQALAGLEAAYAEWLDDGEGAE